MIKINKELSNIPKSLKVPDNSNSSRPSKTTNKRRIELINNNHYIDDNIHNSRYKQKDTKKALAELYHNKCAYCEQKVEQIHVEHYRPKDIYYWLAYSWDNLIFACPMCNIYKSDNFELEGIKMNFMPYPVSNINNVHSSSSIYNKIEKPLLVNPETTDPLGLIKFTKEGKIESDDKRFKYTIEKCRIDRKYLNDARRKILDDFRNRIKAAFLENNDLKSQKVAIKTNLQNYISEAENINSEYIAFRKFAFSHQWLNDIIKEH